MHICNGFTTSRLYDELFRRLNDNEITTTVIAPSFIGEERANHNGFYDLKYFERDTSIISRLQYGQKLKNIEKFADCDAKVANIIHAHTLFSDGIPAYRLAKKYNIPYIVAVRNSDINFFFKYYFHYRRLAYDVLLIAKAIILISPVYRTRLKRVLPNRIFAQIENKIRVIPNGVNQSWFENRIHISKEISKRCLNIVFCGSFDKNKNILRLIQAFNKILISYPQAHLTLIGYNPLKNSRYVKKICDISTKSHGAIEIKKRLAPEEIREIYADSHIFAMPSLTETFGLVYVEALTQGLPLIYTKNEGFDGFFEDGLVGYSTIASDVQSITKALANTIEEYGKISKRVTCTDLSQFNWDKVARAYEKLYRMILFKSYDS